MDFMRVKSHCFGFKVFLADKTFDSMQEDKLDGRPGSKQIPHAASSMIKKSWKMVSGPDVSFDALACVTWCLKLYDFLLFPRAIALDVGVFSQH